MTVPLIVVPILLFGPNERRVAQDRPVCRRQVKKVDHYYPSVDALTQPMQVREDSPPYGTRDQ